MARRRSQLSSGLTPAGAGSTRRYSRCGGDRRAYPRRCGEHFKSPIDRPFWTGLPPQVRGAPATRPGSLLTAGLTPAGAGSTDSLRLRVCPNSAYPRRCGEHRRDGTGLDITPGLPPQVRGALEHVADREIGLGLPPQVRGALDNATVY